MGVAVGNMIEPFVNKEFHMILRLGSECWKTLSVLMYLYKKPIVIYTPASFTCFKILMPYDK